ncbi:MULTISPECIES: malonyl CoA-ACP transacylase [Pseudidiomarina]|uniref:Malonyl CoA-acyl carrier protein transacylase n=2 Tax=Pseudidiomarina TaxID=2800384 RepID=A0A368UMU1_9GAMM|nr:MULTISPECIES: malonyl CoA-ACP transacylase [Pseudidiomarina]PWW10466.1 malonyl CoA-acyl carrier protein transacylase [Pseudidiomarina maritima]RBP88106.1 malonyl CoA-acyl carrier protein transacylase [Pseudidiomarina tainanensis]RCW30117.1 malonyl CoA-acyl carrier protein transacylase [Pseudidiomarina tainanensis]
MTSSRKTAVVVCPGRGTYNKPELGSISNALPAALQSTLAQIDHTRTELNLATVSELDQAPLFKSSLHQRPEHAAALIYAGGYLDYQALNTDKFEVVAITGNSMGWYTAMACAESWNINTSTRLVTRMAQLTAGGAGAQFIYPVVDEQWRPCAAKQAAVAQQLERFAGDLKMSIKYGGYAVLAGSEAACSAAMAALPRLDERFPMLLPGHAAFHTHFMQQASQQALAEWPAAAFHAPQTPLIDGRGQIWPAHVTHQAALQQYTLGHQVTETYDFSKVIQTAAKEFAPDHFILLGPGAGLGGAVAQALIEINWQGLDSKAEFSARQQVSLPYVLSMGLPEQRALVTG